MDNIHELKKCKNLKEIKHILSGLELKDIENIILILNNYYYNKQPLLDDYIYDNIIDYIETNYSSSDILKKIGHKELEKKIKLPFYLGSETKLYDNKKLQSWLKKNKNPKELIISAKADGISILWDIRNKILYTRGDGTYGRNVSNFFPFFKPYINNIFKEININEILYIRGELVAIKPYNRSTVAGQINSKIYNEDICKYIYFYAHEILEPRYSQEKQFDLLINNNINTVSYDIIKKINLDILSKKLLNYKTECNYDVDGLVIRTTEITSINIEGNPSWSISYKQNTDFADTKILYITWNISKRNVYIPVAIIEPIELKNTKINQVSCHNANYVKKNKLGENAVIRIIKSGDIIPNIDKVIKPAVNVIFPDGKWNGVNIEAYEISDDVILRKILEFFKILEIKKIYKNIIIKLIPIYKIKNIYDLLQIELSPKTKQEKFLDDGINNIKKNIYYDYILLSALSLEYLSTKRCKIILHKYPDLIANWNNKSFDLISIDGINEILNTKIIKEIDQNYNLISDIFNLIKTEHTEDKTKINKKILIELSGFRTLHKYLSNDMLNHIFLTSIKNANYLVVNDKDIDSNKVKYAKKNDIPIITIHELISIVKNIM